MLELVAFLCGASLMVLEMAGSRLLAPHLGTSIVVWTALIGVILASMSVGYWLGGRASDKNPSPKTLARIILAAAGVVLLAAFIHAPLLATLAGAGMSLHTAAVLAALLLFAPPALLLGMVSPYVIQVKLRSLRDSGKTGAIMGRFFALSTAGSILGTFLGGYVLISYLGTRAILYAVAATLALSALLAAPKKNRLFPLLALVCSVAQAGHISMKAPKDPASGLELDTLYNHLRIFEGNYAANSRKMRFLSTDPGSVQSGMYVDKPVELALDYTKHYALAWHMTPEARRFLMLGGGGYSVPKHLLAAKPQAIVDVVEIDPGITGAARQYFALPEDRRLAVFHEDARVFLNRMAAKENTQKYDIIMGDTFTSNYNIPFHLGTVECAERIKALLAENGVFLCNIISALTGEQGQLLRGIRASYARVFPQIHLFPVSSPHSGDTVQNVMLLAVNGDRPIPLSWDPEIRAMLAKEWKKNLPDDIPPLWDDFAPVERYAMPLLR